MKIAAAILTYQTVTVGRVTLLRDTVASIAAETDRLAIVDNGSTDGTAAILEQIAAETGAEIVANKSRYRTSGAGTNLQAAWCEQTDADLCVLSDDDMVWRPGWADRLRDWWTVADPSVMLTGCHLEPPYAWSLIVGRQHPALFRTSTGAATWTFRRGTWPEIGPVPRKRQGWSDIPACMSLRDRGYTIAQLDLAEHRGVSTWGNVSSAFDPDAVTRVRDFLNEPTENGNSWQPPT